MHFRAHVLSVLCVAILAVPCQRATGEVRVLTIDLSDSLKAANPVATGILGNWFDESHADGYPDSLISALSPNVLSGRYPMAPDASGAFVGNWDKQLDENARIAEFGARSLVTMRAPWYWMSGVAETDPGFYHPSDSVVWDVWSHWTDLQVSKTDSAAAIDGNEFEFGIFHEANDCDGDDETEYHWPDTLAAADRLFYEMWHATYDSIQVHSPGATVVGPGFVGICIEEEADVNFRPSYCETHYDELEVTFPNLAGFAAYCDSVGQWPDRINWHSMGCCPAELQHQNNVYEEADSISSFLSQYSGAPSSLCVTEALTADQYLAPGALVWYFRLAEKAAADFNLEYVVRAYWVGGSGQDEGNYLGGLIDQFEASGTFKQPRGAWWLTRYYASLGSQTGHFIDVPESDDRVAGLAAKSPSERAALLIGSYYDDPPDSITVVFKNLSNVTGLVVDGIVEADLQWITGDPDSALVGGIEEADFAVVGWPHRYLVEGDSVEIVLTGDSVPDSLGAVHLVLSQPVFEAVNAAQQASGIRDAIEDFADLGDTVKVEGTGVTFDAFVMKPRLPVIHSGGSTPVVAALSGSTTVIRFPSGVDSLTYVEGLEIQAESSVDDVVLMEGGGKLEGCKVTGAGYMPEALLRANSDDVVLRGCEFSVDSTFTGYYAIHVVGDRLQFEGNQVTIEDGGTALRVDGEVLTIRDCWFEGSASANTGISAPADSAHLENVTVKGFSVNGIVVGGTSMVTSCTVDGAGTYGIAMYGGLLEKTIVDGTDIIVDPTTDVRDCIITGDIAMAYGTTPDTVGVATEDPLFCSDEYTLRVDSYGSPRNNPSETLIGAHPVACWSGILQRSTSYEGTITLEGTATVDTSLVLEFEAGTTINAEAVAKAEVQGVLLLSGDSSDSVVVESSGGWDGISVEAGGSLGVQYASIRGATDCVYAVDSAGLADSIGLSHVTLEDFDASGVWLERTQGGSGATFNGEYLVVNLTGGTNWGIIVDAGSASGSGYSVDLGEVAITGASGDLGGILVNDEGDGGTRAQLSQVTVSGLTSGAGIQVEGYSPKIHDVTVSNCKWGFKLLGSSSPTLKQYDAGDTIVVSDGTTGIYVGDSSDPTLQGVGVSNPSGGTGLYTASSASGDFSELRISAGSYGVQVYGTNSHTLRDSKITGFSLQGVRVGAAGDIDLGTSNDHGDNDIHSSESTVSKYVSAKNHLGSLGPVPAEYNWWGEYPPPSSMFTTSQVDYTPASGSAHHPLSLEDRIEVVQVPTILSPSLRFSPNPFHTGGVLEFAIPEATDYRVELYSLTGRLVKSLGAGFAAQQEVRRVTWDGHGDGGRRVATGVYFLRLVAGGEVLVKKIVRLP